MKFPFTSLLALALVAFVSHANAYETAPVTGGVVVGTSSVSLGTAAATVLAQDNSRGFLQIENTTSVTNILACTIDGTTPVVNSNGISLQPYGIVTFSEFVPRNVVKCIGSASSTGYQVNYLP